MTQMSKVELEAKAFVVDLLFFEKNWCVFFFSVQKENSFKIKIKMANETNKKTPMKNFFPMSFKSWGKTKKFFCCCVFIFFSAIVPIVFFIILMAL